jgi:hypothetical protein
MNADRPLMEEGSSVWKPKVFPKKEIKRLSEALLKPRLAITPGPVAPEQSEKNEG